MEKKQSFVEDYFTQERVIALVPDLHGFKSHIREYWKMKILNEVDDLVFAVPDFLSFEATCLVALHVYIHLTHHSLYCKHDFETVEDPKGVVLFCKDLRIPRYVLDMIREVARPMIWNSSITVLPYLPLHRFEHEQGLGSEPGLGIKIREFQIAGVLAVILGPHALMPLTGEYLPATAFSVSLARRPVQQIAFQGGTFVPQWRFEAFSILRHVQPTCKWYLKFSRRVEDAHKLSRNGCLGACFMKLHSHTSCAKSDYLNPIATQPLDQDTIFLDYDITLKTEHIKHFAGIRVLPFPPQDLPYHAMMLFDALLGILSFKGITLKAFRESFPSGVLGMGLLDFCVYSAAAEDPQTTVIMDRFPTHQSLSPIQQEVKPKKRARRRTRGRKKKTCVQKIVEDRTEGGGEELDKAEEVAINDASLLLCKLLSIRNQQAAPY